MKYRDITESSGYSLEGSWTKDLVFSKLWVSRELQRIMQDQGIDEIPVAYVIGSWYGNMSILLRRSGVNIGRIIDVERNTEWLELGHKIQQQMGLSDIEPMNKDANELDYRQLGDPGLVINTSLNDVKDTRWFRNIPTGTLVVLQGRDSVAPGTYHRYDDPKDILGQYPLNTVLYKGTLDLTDPETDYQRSMVIGKK